VRFRVDGRKLEDEDTAEQLGLTEVSVNKEISLS
jgi:hypothetical protein